MGGGSSKKQTVGYKYYLGAHMALCHGPVDKISRIAVDDREAWSGSVTNNSNININKPELFGGEKREGGISGRIAIMMGGLTQKADSYLVNKLPGLVPSFRGVVSAVLAKVYMGNNPYLKPWSWRVQRIHKRGIDGRRQWYDKKAEIGGAGASGTMNPAHIIHDCLTDPEWGMGYNEADLDATSFVTAADRLYDEGFGLCLLWSRQITIEEFVVNVLAHIDGAVYVDRSSGKFVLKLLRDDYNPDTIPLLDENSIIEVRDFLRPAIGELTNAVTVQYWDMSTGNDDSLTVQDIALAQQQGSVISTTKQYPGIPNADLAAKVAARDLKGVSTPLIACTITANRTAAGLNIGDVFKLSWEQYGIAGVVMRVVKLGFGVPNDGKITIECVQDAFSLSDAIYAPPPPTDWESPINDPIPVALNIVREAPYWELAQRLGDVEAKNIGQGEAYVVGSGVRPTTDAINAGLYLGADSGANVSEAGITDFCASALLAEAIDELATAFTIVSPQAIETVSIGSYFEINNEYMEVVAVSETAMTVKRGVLDTIPQKHLVNDRLFFWEEYASTDEKIYLEGEKVFMKLTTATGNGELLLANATAASTVIAGRAFLPYPPARIQIQGQYFPLVFNSNTNASVAWAHRDRKQQTSVLVDFYQGNIGPETGTTYHVRINDEDGVEVVNDATITGTSYIYSAEIADLGKNCLPPSGIYSLTPAPGPRVLARRNSKLDIKLKSRRDGVDCLHEFTHTVHRDGYGYNYGNFYGGH